MPNETQAPAVAPRVTIDDVRAVIGTDPNATNASKVRALLGGRGSFETIQRHLGTLRAELAAAAMPPGAVDQVPALPGDAAQAMWVAAWTAAQVQTMARSEKLASERDAALLKLETMGQDVAGLVATVDQQAGQLDHAAVAVAKVQADHLADLQKAEAVQAAAAADRAELAQVLVKVQADAAHAAELAESGRVVLREELARLTDQVGELKAHLYARAAASVPP